MRTILCIDDHGLFRAGLALVIKGRLPATDFLAASSIEEAMALDVQPDVILLDLQLDGISGLDGLPMVKARWPAGKVVVLTSDSNHGTADAVMAQGADAYALKANSPDRIVEALLTILPSWADDTATPLTGRQLDILRLVEQGVSNKGIARKLGLSEFTVRGHVQNICRQLGADSRTAAVYQARRLGLL